MTRRSARERDMEPVAMMRGAHDRSALLERRWRALLILTVVAARGLGAQTAGQTTPGGDSAGAAQSITAAEIARHVEVIAHDSMRGRDTPSPGLEHTARYVAEQFKALGLHPAGDSGGWLQRYSLPGHSPVDADRSPLILFSKAKRGAKAVVTESGEPMINYKEYKDTAGGALVIAADTVLDGRAPGAQGGGQAGMAAFDLYGPAPVVVAGPHTIETLRQANLHDKVVVYIPAPEADSVVGRQLLQVLTPANHVIIVADEDSAAFAHRRESAHRQPPVVLDWYLAAAQRPRRWAAYVWAPAIRETLVTAGFDPTDPGVTQRPTIRELAALARLHVSTGPASAEHTAPNVLGLVPGTDPSQVIVVTAHMDHTGLRRGQRDSIANGADDNASGVAGLLALAKAFTRLGTPPRRSLLFAAVSGGARGKEFWGSAAVLDGWQNLGTPVLNLTLDQIGRAPGDSLRLAGLGDVELPVRSAWLAAEHPELGLTVVDGGTVSTPASDHFAFVRKAVPSLYLHAGVQDGAGGAVDAGEAVDALDAAQESRIVRLAFYLLQELANAPRAPRWTAEGRRQRIQVFGR